MLKDWGAKCHMSLANSSVSGETGQWKRRYAPNVNKVDNEKPRHSYVTLCSACNFHTDCKVFQKKLMMKGSCLKIRLGIKERK